LQTIRFVRFWSVLSMLPRYVRFPSPDDRPSVRLVLRDLSHLAGLATPSEVASREGDQAMSSQRPTDARVACHRGCRGS
jgi:hypothetical protein